VYLKNLTKTLFVTVAILLAVSGAGYAQDNKIKVSADEADAIKKIEKAKTLADKIKATQDFLKKYPQSPARPQAAEYLAGEIARTKDDAQIIQNGETYLTIFTEPAETDLILPDLVYSYSATNRPKDAFGAAEKYFARHPDDVVLRYKLAIDGSNLLRSGTKDYALQSRDYALKSIELIEANKKPANLDDARWKEYQTKYLPSLYQTVGVYEYNMGDKAKAQASLVKATSLDAKDVNSWLLLSTMLDDEYQELARQYNVADEGAARDALLKKANDKLDQVMEGFARIVALTDGRPEAKNVNDQIRQSLETYYKYRHKNLDGLPALIGKYKN